MRLSDMGIGARLLLALAPPVAMLVLIAAAGLWRLAALNDEFTRIVQDRHASTDLINAVILENHVILGAARGLLLEAADAPRAAAEGARITRSRAAVAAMLERLDRALATQPQAGPLLQAVHTRHSAYQVDLVRFMRHVEAGRAGEARAILDARLAGGLQSSLEAMQALSALQTAAMKESVAAASESYRVARELTLGLVTLALLASAMIATWLARSISRPLRAAIGVAQSVAAGRLSDRIEAQGRDETGALMAALKSMNEGLAGIVGDVRGSAGRVSDAARHLVAANDELAARTSEQAASLEQAAASMEQFAASAARNAESAAQAAQLAASAAGVAQEGAEAVARMISTMTTIDAGARKVAEILAFIDRVAFQTHVLALNAAVEAARAGSQGMGFAVIAAEVRELAARSSGAAREVRALTSAAAEDIARGVSIAQDAGRIIDETREAARAVAGLMSDISGASHEQRSGVGQMNGMLAALDRVTQGNAALVEELSAAMRLLQGEARRLMDAVQVFELGEAPAPAHEGRPAAPVPLRLALRAPAPGAGGATAG